MANRYRCTMPVQEASVPVKVPVGRPKKGAERPKAPRALVRGTVHYFTVLVEVEPPPRFAPVRCEAHHGSKVIRWGVGNKDGTRRQRYRCEPKDGSQAHTFTPTLPRRAVKLEPEWNEADAVRNPHRGPTASGRGQASTTELVAEGLQMISQGVSYAQVGRWARDKRPRRTRDPVVAATELWALGFRSAQLAEVHAALTEDNFDRRPRSDVLEEALAICDAALAGHDDDPSFERLRARRGRLKRAIDAAAKPPPANPYNKRRPHTPRFAQP